MNVSESQAKVFWHATHELLCHLVIQEVFIIFKAILELFGKLFSNVCWNFMTVYAMAITHHEKMETCLTKQVGSERISVLIDFVRIAGLVTSWSSESKLCDRIESFRLLLSGNVFVLILIFCFSIIVKNIGDCVITVIFTSVDYSLQVSWKLFLSCNQAWSLLVAVGVVLEAHIFLLSMILFYILLVDWHTSLRFAYICQILYNLRLGRDIVFRRRSIVKKDGLCSGNGYLWTDSLMIVRLAVANGK